MNNGEGVLKKIFSGFCSFCILTYSKLHGWLWLASFPTTTRWPGTGSFPSEIWFKFEAQSDVPQCTPRPNWYGLINMWTEIDSWAWALPIIQCFHTKFKIWVVNPNSTTPIQTQPHQTEFNHTKPNSTTVNQNHPTIHNQTKPDHSQPNLTNPNWLGMHNRTISSYCWSLL